MTPEIAELGLRIRNNDARLDASIIAFNDRCNPIDIRKVKCYDARADLILDLPQRLAVFLMAIFNRVRFRNKSINGFRARRYTVDS
jgi:hypothetical protein